MKSKILNFLTTKSAGDFGEKIAEKYLRSEGYKITAKNFRSKHGEIDIIAENANDIVFVEVKSRKDNDDNFRNYGLPCEAVTREKKQHIIFTAKVFLFKHPTDKYIHFDIIEVYFGKTPRVNRIENAFTL